MSIWWVETNPRVGPIIVCLGWNRPHAWAHYCMFRLEYNSGLRPTICLVCGTLGNSLTIVLTICVFGFRYFQYEKEGSYMMTQHPPHDSALMTIFTPMNWHFVSWLFWDIWCIGLMIFKKKIFYHYFLVVTRVDSRSLAQTKRGLGVTLKSSGVRSVRISTWEDAMGK